jgi:RNA polymerase sigma factor (sigma-70 family)
VENEKNRTDAQLIRASAGDAAAFGELYARHVETVHHWVARRAPHIAADVTAETFAAAWLHRRRFRDRRSGSALPWLLGIARNVVRESLRKDAVETRARARIGVSVDLGGEIDDVDDRLSPPIRLADAVDALPPHERTALKLRIDADLPYSDIAQRLEIPPAAARLRVSRALRRLALLPKEEL